MGTALKTLLHPMLNPTGYMAAAGAVYAAVAMIWNATHHHGVISVAVIVAAIGAVSALLTHQVVTPLKAPRDGVGRPLVPLALMTPLPVTTGTGNLPQSFTAGGGGGGGSGSTTIAPMPPAAAAPEPPAAAGPPA